MLDFEASPLDREHQSRTTQFRHGDGLHELIENAAVSLGVNKSVFLRAAIYKEATRVMMARSQHILSLEDSAQFIAALDTPPEPTPRTVAAMKAYKARIIHAD